MELADYRCYFQVAKPYLDGVKRKITMGKQKQTKQSKRE